MKIDDLSRAFQASPQADALKRLAQARPASAPAAEDPKLREAAQQFEQFFLQQLLKQARSTTQAMRTEETSSEQQTYEEWQDESLAKAVASGQGIGLGEMLYKQLIENQMRQTPIPEK
jgi:peptidoglycan hydrolase FlgJ